MQSVINQHLDQLPQAFVSINTDTFPHLPKISNAIGLSTPAMDEVPSKTFKQKSPPKYKKLGCFLRDLDPVIFNPTVDPPPRTCYNCWNMGHLVYDCPKTLTDIFCCNCGRRYVKIDECPRCARVFWDLDESARQWLISYIPGVGQDDQTDCKKKDCCGEDDFGRVELNSDSNRSENSKDFESASEFIQVKSCKNGSFSENSKSEKFNKHDNGKDNLNNLASSTELTQMRNDEKEKVSRESNLEELKFKRDNFKREDSREYESQTTSNKIISEDDQWWNCCNIKEESEKEQFYFELKADRNVIDNGSEIMIDEHFNSVLEKERTKDEDYESFLDDETNYHSDDKLQAANPNAASIVQEHFNFFDQSLRTTSDQDDDYENIIFDEEEQIEESGVVGNAVRDFALLLKAAKYLPFQQQSKLVLKFASDCKKKL